MAELLLKSWISCDNIQGIRVFANRLQLLQRRLTRVTVIIHSEPPLGAEIVPEISSWKEVRKRIRGECILYEILLPEICPGNISPEREIVLAFIHPEIEPAAVGVDTEIIVIAEQGIEILVFSIG